MTTNWVCLLAILAHLSFSSTTTYPTVASQIFSFSVFNILLEIDIIPQRYLPQMSTLSCRVTEFILSVFIVDMAITFVWLRIEQMIETFVECIMMDGDKDFSTEMGGDWWIAVLLWTISVGCYVNTAMVTKQFASMAHRYRQLNEYTMDFLR